MSLIHASGVTFSFISVSRARRLQLPEHYGRTRNPNLCNYVCVNSPCRYGDLIRVFDYYSCSGSGDIFSLQYNAWSELMLSTCIAFDDSVTCVPGDCDLVFKATNFEEVRGM